MGRPRPAMTDDALTDLQGRPVLLRREQRRKMGRERRDEVPLDAHSSAPRESDRGDAIGILTAPDALRLPELVPIRHGRMGATRFTCGYLGTTDAFDRALVEFSNAYDRLNELDHAAHADAIADGRVAAECDI